MAKLKKDSASAIRYGILRGRLDAANYEHGGVIDSFDYFSFFPNGKVAVSFSPQEKVRYLSFELFSTAWESSFIDALKLRFKDEETIKKLEWERGLATGAIVKRTMLDEAHKEHVFYEDTRRKASVTA